MFFTNGTSTLNGMQQDISRRDIVITGVVIVLLVASLIGWLVYKYHESVVAKAKVEAAVARMYAGWSIDNSSVPGLSFHYPDTWTDVDSHSTCTGALLVTITPPAPEIEAAKTGPQYYLEIEKYGTQNADCPNDGTNLEDITFASIDSSDQLQSGAFKKDWLTFFSDGNSAYKTTKADTAVITPNAYNGSQTKFSGRDTISFKGSTYQFSIETSTTETQTETPSSISINSFEMTQLYKDTLRIFNSIQQD